MPRPVACPVGASLLIRARSRARTDDGRADARVLTIKEALRLLDLLMKQGHQLAPMASPFPTEGMLLLVPVSLRFPSDWHKARRAGFAHSCH